MLKACMHPSLNSSSSSSQDGRVEAMELEEKAEKKNGNRKRSTLDHQLTHREGVLQQCCRAVWPCVSDGSNNPESTLRLCGSCSRQQGIPIGGGQMAFPPVAEQKLNVGNPSGGFLRTVPAVVHRHLCKDGCIHLAWNHARGCAVV